MLNLKCTNKHSLKILKPGFNYNNNRLTKINKTINSVNNISLYTTPENSLKVTKSLVDNYKCYQSHNVEETYKSLFDADAE